jgi:hypothetical protein
LKIHIYVDVLKYKYFRDTPELPICSYDANATQCDAMQLGLLYRYLLAGDTVSTDGASLRDIAEKVQKIPAVKLETCKPDTYCQCGTLVVGHFTHNCSYAISHKDCSWVPGLGETVENALDAVRGLEFSELPSRTWE